MSELDTLFDGMASSAIAGKGQYLPPGFIGKVEFLPLKYNPNGDKGKSIAFEYKVLESNLPSVEVGAIYTQVVMLVATNKYANSDLKQIMFAVLGIDANKTRAFEVDPGPHNEATSALKAAIKEPSQIEGSEACLRTMPYVVQKGPNAGKTIALPKWAATDEAIADRSARTAPVATAA